MATETVSPPYHCTFWVRIFHSGLGMRPPSSWGRSTPVGAPSPIFLAQAAMRVISRRMPRL